MGNLGGNNKETSRRDFLKAVSMTSAIGLTSGHNFAGHASGLSIEADIDHSAPPASAGIKKFIAMQISPQSFVDEGVDKCLDMLQEKGRVNVIMPVSFSYGWELDGHQVHGRPLPDHGAQTYDDIRGGSYTKVNPEFYRDSPLLQGIRAPE
jgi:hypothetical protein